MTAQEFLATMAETANTHNFSAHMNLISKEVKVHGLPDFEQITYNDWFNQCKKEFSDRLLTNVSYQGLHVLAEAANRIQFIAVETTKASDGHVNIYCIEFTIQKENDGYWRVVQERIMQETESKNDNKHNMLQ